MVSASRTDTGVHALAQVACFRTASELPVETFVKGLNHYLPPEVAVLESYRVNGQFHVQRSAVSRAYRYLVWNSWTRSALKKAYTYQVGAELDLGAMNEACDLLKGEHDLASFVTAFRRSVIKSTLRTIYQAGFERQGKLVVFTITANSFLPHQVRNTVGTLLRLGQGKIDLVEFKNIMEAKKPGLAGPTVPAQGLYLEKVNYPRPLGDYHEDL